eukprot:scaffold5101_cov224-Skeletonema_dohrnii-CCMP3373.AAC.1
MLRSGALEGFEVHPRGVGSIGSEICTYPYLLYATYIPAYLTDSGSGLWTVTQHSTRISTYLQRMKFRVLGWGQMGEDEPGSKILLGTTVDYSD